MARRILLLITDLEIGGTPTVVRELATRLRDPGRVEVEVACLSRWGPVADQLAAAGVRVTPLDARRVFSLPLVVRRFVRLVRDRRIDTVFSFLVHANAVAALGARWCPGVRFLQSVQTTQPRPEWHWHVQSRAGRRAERIVVPSDSVASVVTWWSPGSAPKLVVIPNAVDAATFPGVAPPPAGARPFPIGFIGRLDPVKRVPVLVDAVADLGGLVHLHVFGDGRERGRIERRIADRGAARLVTMHGSVARPQDALRHLGLLVLPSEAEGFGLVLIEAMAAGVPVVASYAPGIRDVVEDGRTGLLPRGGRAGLAGAIRAMVEKPWLRARMAEAALAAVRRRFDWSAVIPQYREVLALPGPAGPQPRGRD